jgi:hypothetical protein
MLAICAFCICSCVTTYPSIKDINDYESKDQEIIIGMLRTLQSSLNERDVDKWFDLYSANATITYTKNRPTPKKEVVESVRKEDLNSWRFQIEDIKIIKIKIEQKSAIAKTILKMNTGGSVKNHPETYYFSKTNGKWLIDKETNP